MSPHNPPHELERTARAIRGAVVEMSHRSREAHLGSALSVVDILVSLYWECLLIDPRKPEDPARDRLILSKGHAASALYAVLAARGFFPETLLETYSCRGSCLEGHPGPGCAPGVEAATGSLGHGLPLAAGMALAGRIRGLRYRTVAVMSDGEMNEGSVWEAAQFVSGVGLDTVMAVIDFNGWQATGRSRDVLRIEPLAEKWRSFGWTAVEVNGHDIGTLTDAFSSFPRDDGAPLAVIAHTVKGRGVSFMEDDNNWHYRIPTADEVAAAKRELGLA